MTKRIFLSLVFYLASSVALRAAGTDTIVVMPFENLSGRSEYHWVGESFAANLSDLLDKPGLVAIRPDERNVAYKQEGLPPTAILTRATMIKIAERAGANLVVMGTYRVEGEGRESTISVTSRVVDINEGRLIGREVSRGGPLIDLQRLQGELAYEILYQRNPALPFSRDQIITQSTQAPIGAFENFIKGTLTRDREARKEFLDRAIKEYFEKTNNQSEKTNRHYMPAIFELGRVHYEAGDYKEAVENLALIDSADPRYDEAQFYIGAAQDILGQTDKALETNQKLAPRLPLYEVYNNIGVLLVKKKDYAGAVNHLKPAADVAPRDTDMLFNLGYAYFLAKDYPAAADTLQKELERRPSDGEAFYVLSKSLAAAGNKAEAEKAADQAKRLLPAFAQWETKGMPVIARVKTSFSKANYYRYKRDQDERLNPQPTPGGQPPTEQLLEAARNAFFAGRDEEALATLGNLLQAAPQNYEAHLLMGRVYERRGDFDRATNALKAAAFWNPKLVAAHVLLGRIQVLKNDCQAARASLDKALGVDANDQDAQALKRMIEQRCAESGSNQSEDP
ncbi:MAG: tetratricopeptide repeat protein [Blastocatellia bacterium]|nr:tetratricopeptide repeat protein [Blastocatellia bacterium]